MSSAKPRVYLLDVLRALAIMLVVMGHSVEQTFHFADVNVWEQQGTAKALVVMLLFTIARISVPFFLFLTGYLFLPRDYDYERAKGFFIHNFARLLFVTEVWIVLYNLFNAFFWNIPFTLKSVVRQMAFLDGVPAMDHYWYLPMILGLYLFLPLIAAGLKHIPAKALVLPVGILLAALTIAPSFGFTTESILESGFSGGVYGLYLLLGYMVHENVFRNIPGWLLGLTAAFGILWTQVVEYIWAGRGEQVVVWYTWGSLILASAALFELCVRAAKPAEVPTKAHAPMTFVAKYSFAVYLVHFPLVQIAVRVMYWNTSSAFLTFIVAFFVPLLLSLLFCRLLDRIPKVGRYLLYMR